MTISWSTCTANSWYWKKWVVPTELEESTWRIKIIYISLELYHVNTNIFVIIFFKDRDVWFACSIYYCHRHRWIRHQHPLFCKLWNTIYREIINIMTIMMKTIKKTFESLYKKYLDGLGSCLFLEFTFVFFTSDIQSP